MFAHFGVFCTNQPEAALSELFLHVIRHPFRSSVLISLSLPCVLFLHVCKLAGVSLGSSVLLRPLSIFCTNQSESAFSVLSLHFPKLSGVALEFLYNSVWVCRVCLILSCLQVVWGPFRGCCTSQSESAVCVLFLHVCKLSGARLGAAALISLSLLCVSHSFMFASCLRPL